MCAHVHARIWKKRQRNESQTLIHSYSLIHCFFYLVRIMKETSRVSDRTNQQALQPHTPSDTGFAFPCICLQPSYHRAPALICKSSRCLSLGDTQSQRHACNKWMWIFLLIIHWLVSRLSIERQKRKRSGIKTKSAHLCSQGTKPNAHFLVITDNKTDPQKWPRYIAPPPESIFLTPLSAQRPHCFVVLTEEMSSDWNLN